MKVKLLRDAIVPMPAGSEVEIADEKAALLLMSGAAEAVTEKPAKAEKKAAKAKK